MKMKMSYSVAEMSGRRLKIKHDEIKNNKLISFVSPEVSFFSSFSKPCGTPTTTQHHRIETHIVHECKRQIATTATNIRTKTKDDYIVHFYECDISFY